MMKLVSVLMARSVWFFDFAEFNPKGLNLWPMFEDIASKYKFSSAPKNLLDLDEEKALAFRFGAFINSKGENVVVSLKTYSNGVSVDASSSTDDADEFLQQVAALASKEFGLNIPSNVRRVYVSQIEVETEFSLGTLNPRLVRFAESLSGAASTADGKPRRYDFGALQFWTEDTDPGTSPSYFRFERRVGVPFSRNRYFCQAPLKTKEHLEFVDVLTKSLA